MTFKMTFEALSIPDSWKIFPSVHSDTRGLLWSFTQPDFVLPSGVSLSFSHVKFSSNCKNVIRGIHGDFQTWKLVSCVSGSMQQVLFDNRKSSPTFNQSLSFVISSDTPCFLLLPPGVGNAFKALHDNTVYVYGLAYKGNYIDCDRQFTIPYDSVGIEWLGDSDPILSLRDTHNSIL